MNKLKLVGYVAVLILILNVFLFSFRLISPLVFWIVIGVGAGLVYLVVPKMKK